MIQVIRFLALLCILSIALVPQDQIQLFKQSEMQLLAAILVAIVIVMVDVYAGLVLGVALIILYQRLYGDMLMSIANVEGSDKGARGKGPMACLISKYITDDDLTNAQNNVVDEAQLDTQIVGISDVDTDQVFGAQGMYQKITGMDYAASKYADPQLV